MATKFKKGDIVKVTEIHPDSIWYYTKEINVIKTFKLELISVTYIKDKKYYFIDTTILEGCWKDILYNSNLTISGCKIKRYDNKLSKV